jgi:hypothetical protein
MDGKSIKFDLLENGLDFILSSIKLTVEAESEVNYKYSILHLSAGVELLLKERLRVEDWIYVFENIEKATEDGLKSGDFVSVRLETALERLMNDLGIEIDEEDIKAIKDLKRRRNKVEHFQFHETEISIKSISAKVLNFVFKFINGELNDSIDTEKLEEQFFGIKENLTKFKEFINVREEELKNKVDEISKDTIIIKCPSCYQDYLVLSLSTNNKLKCLFCLQNDSPDSFAFDYLENVLGYSHYLSVKEGGDFPLYDCPECGMNTFVETPENYICFNCCEITSHNRIDNCSQCGQKFYSDDEGIGVCTDCWNYKLSTWD